MPKVYDGFANLPPDVQVVSFSRVVKRVVDEGGKLKTIEEVVPEDKITKDEYLEESDINTLMRRYEQQGIRPDAPPHALYQDFATAPDFMAAQLLVANAVEQFEALSAPVRAEFDNDPEKFLAFVHDPKNLDRAEELGLLSAEAAVRRAGERAAAAELAAAKDAAYQAALAASKKGGDGQ